MEKISLKTLEIIQKYYTSSVRGMIVAQVFRYYLFIVDQFTTPLDRFIMCGWVINQCVVVIFQIKH